MKIVYLGSGDIGLPVLRALWQAHPLGRHELRAVVTQPDRPAGRHLRLVPGPIKALALQIGVPILQPERLRRTEAVDALRALEADVIAVFAYGQILPPAVLALPRVACINLHASLLPRYRGAAPIQAAIAAGDRESGLTVMYMAEGLDTGDILLQRAIPLRGAEAPYAERDTAGTLHDRLATLAPEALFEALDLLAAGRAPRIPQDASLATYAPKLERQGGLIDWTRSSAEIERHVRAMNPWPAAFTLLPGAHPRVLKVFAASVVPDATPAAAPGTVVGSDQQLGPMIAAGDGSLVLHDVQLEGKRRMPASEFLRGHPLPVGVRLGPPDTRTFA